MSKPKRTGVVAVINPASTAMDLDGDEVRLTWKFRSADLADEAFSLLVEGFKHSQVVIDLPDVEESWETKGAVQ
jgi:hypothetical protein